MTKGKYTQRADTRLKVLESEALREAHAKIATLKTELADVHHALNTTKAQVQSLALETAGHLSAREKQHLRNKITSLEHQDADERIRYALLTWELMHRRQFNEPSPQRLHPESHPESYRFWLDVHWDIGALFISDYDEFWQFFKIVQGYEWRYSGDIISTGRELARNLHKGRIATSIVKRIRAHRAYYERIWKARQAGAVEPITYSWQGSFNEFDDVAPEDRRDYLVEKMRSHKQDSRA